MDANNIPCIKLNELYLKPGERYDPPDGTPVLRPFKELTQFFPAAQASPYVWLPRFRSRYIQPLGAAVASLFQVPLIDDVTYTQMPEEMKATYLSCIMTDANLSEVATGHYEWDAICVVARYMIMVAIQIHVDPSNQKIKIPRMLLWSKKQQEYVPVFDQTSGELDPRSLVAVLERYVRLEGFAQ